MIHDSERREVAARLRKAIGLHEFAEVLGFDWTDDSDRVWNDVSNLVADLIEPGEPEARCVAEVKVDGERLEQLVRDAAVEMTGIDRDALLALAYEIDTGFRIEGSTGPAHQVVHFVNIEMRKYASRIREALGVEK